MLVTVGFLLVVTGFATSEAKSSQEPRRKALIDQVLSERRNVDDLDQAVEELREQVAQARATAGQVSTAQAGRNADEATLAMAAGAKEVKGSGLVITLSDASRPTNEDTANFDAKRIQDGDIQLIVNALFAAGAEAIGINDNRVVVVTPIRAAGGTIVVNYRPVNSPYRIAAIGADKERFSESEVAANFRQWKKKYDLGFNVETEKSIKIPAYSGRVGIDVAQAQIGRSGA